MRPAETGIVITAEKNVRFSIIVRVMDAARNDRLGRMLFPHVILAAGIV